MYNLISRQEAIDALNEQRALYCDNSPESFGRLSYDEKCRVDEIDTAIGTIVNLPPARPNQKVGKWQVMVDRGGFTDWFCSLCGGSGRGDYSFCPWCSAKMED